MWAHESRANLEPLRFSTHERSGVGSESGLAGELFSRFFSLEISANSLLFVSKIRGTLGVSLVIMAGHARVP